MAGGELSYNTSDLKLFVVPLPGRPAGGVDKNDVEKFVAALCQGCGVAVQTSIGNSQHLHRINY